MGRIKSRERGYKQFRDQNKIIKSEDKKSDILDDLAEFEEFRDKILKLMRQDLYNGATTEQLREKYAPMVQAKLLTKAITDDDTTAITAAKDILDRSEGKAKERLETTHKLERLSDEELDALVLTKLEHMDDAEDKGKD